MKHFATVLTAVLALAMPVLAATPEQEKAFVDSYKKAFEAGDNEALAAFLYTEGAQPEQIKAIKMVHRGHPGAKVESIELVTPSAADAERFSKPMTMPNGKSYVMDPKPTKQLVVVFEQKPGNSSSKITVKSPVAEKDGKLVIPVPVPAKK